MNGMLKKLESRARAQMKELAGNRGLSGYKSFDLYQLSDLLYANLKGFQFDCQADEIIFSWLDDKIRTEIRCYIIINFESKEIGVDINEYEEDIAS